MYTVSITIRKEGKMKTVINTIAGFLIAGGLMAMAGSANDCDGACMEQANTLGEMLMVAGIGAAMMAFGAMILLNNRAEG
jgi:hypothetical protein